MNDIDKRTSDQAINRIKHILEIIESRRTRGEQYCSGERLGPEQTIAYVKAQLKIISNDLSWLTLYDPEVNDE